MAGASTTKGRKRAASERGQDRGRGGDGDGESESEGGRGRDAKPRTPSHDAPRASTRVPYHARVVELACDEAEDVGEARQRLDGADSGVLERIRKALKLAQHPNTGEHEAHQALRLATRLMQSQNLSQADLLADEVPEETRARAGKSDVAVRSTRGKTVPQELWASTLARAITDFFDVKVYSVVGGTREKVLWTFYGLAVNTVAAAMSFEMVFNQALHWAADSPIAKGRVGKNSYLNGISDGLLRLARQERREEEARAIGAEQKRLRDAERDEAATRAKEEQRLHGLDGDAGKSAKVEDASDDEVVFVSSSGPHLKPDPAGPSSAARVKAEPRSAKVEDAETAASADVDVKPAWPGSAGLTQPDSPAPLMPGGWADRGFGGESDNDADDDDDNAGGVGDEVKPDFDEAEEAAADDDVEGYVIKGEGDDDDEDRKPVVKPEPRGGGQSGEPPRRPLPRPVAAAGVADDARRDAAGAADRKPKIEEVGGITWQSHGQLQLFRGNAARIADEYLASAEVKLRTGRKFARPKHDAASYRQGREDSKKIHVRRRRIGAE